MASDAAVSTRVPDLAGLFVDDAKDALTRAGLTYSTSQRESATDHPGQVLAQSPAAGAAVEPGASVDLTIAKAPSGQAVAPIAGVAGVVAGATAASAAAAATLIGGLMATMRQRQEDDYVFLVDQLTTRFPDRPQADLRDLARLEQTYEAAFQKGVLERLRKDIPRVLAIKDPEQRKAALQGILDREKRYQQQREEAMVARAMARADQLYLMDSSPEGAYWKLSPYVKEHTLDCLALGERFWPWEVLKTEGPPRHYGCPCYLLGKDEAIALGYMTADDVPNPVDAIARARRALRDLQEAREEGLTAELEEAYIDALALDEAERWAAGTDRGGEFKPKVGGSARRLMRGLLPRRVNARVAPHVGRRRDEGRWATIRGRTVRVPVRDWRRSIDGVTFTSPAGGTNIYRDGKLAAEAGQPAKHRDLLPLPRPSTATPAPATDLTTPRMRELGARISDIRAQIRSGPTDSARVAAASHENPTYVGAGPEAVPALRSAGFSPIAVNDGALTLRGPGGTVGLRIGDDHVESVDHQPPAAAVPRRAAGRAPETFDEHRADALAWADSLGQRYGAQVNVPDLTADPSLFDHAGSHEWDGTARIGGQARSDIEAAARARRSGRELTDDERRGQYSAYWVTAHEIAHGVNPIAPELYAGGDANLEEALTEETSHDLALQRLKAQGQDDVVAWALASPGAVPVQGSYLPERSALGSLLDQAQITDPDERLDFVNRLKFRTPPADRMQAIADEWAKAQGADSDNALAHVEATMDHASDHSGTLRPIVDPTSLTSSLPGPANPGTSRIPDYAGIPLTLGQSAGGSNGARWAEGPDGERWLVKTYRGNQDRVATEVLANAIYREMGARAPVAGTIESSVEPDFREIPDVPIAEPPLPRADAGQPKLRISTGMVVREPDGRVWIYEPKGHFDGYEHTFPKGGLEGGLSPQQNAHKELWEETGLHAAVTGYVGDFQGTTGVTRYYAAVRTGGEPHADDPTPYVKGGSETAAVKLVTPQEAVSALNTDRDQQVLAAALAQPMPAGPRPDTFPSTTARALAYPALDGEVKEHVFDHQPPSAELGQHFMTDALLANWDFVGLDDDNIMWDPQGHPVRLDQGGTLEYRAQGKMKPFGPVPTEVWTMMSPKGQGFGAVAIDAADKREQADRIAQTLTPERIDTLVDQAPFADLAQRARIRQALKDRVAWMRLYADGEVTEPQPLQGAGAREVLSARMASIPLDPDDEWAIAAYRDEPGEVTDHLRSGAPASAASEHVQDIVHLLDGATRSITIPQDTIAYVGIPSSGDDALIGRTLREPAFLSATTDLAAVDDAPATLRLTLPVGAPALFDAGGEPQIIMPRNTTMKIVGRSSENGRDYLDAVTIPSVWGSQPISKALAESILEEAAAGNTGAMVALYPRPSIAKAMAIDGGEDVDELHITLAFLGKAADLDGDKLKDVVKAFAAACPPIAGSVSGKGLFVGGDKPVTYASADLPGLAPERERLVELLDKAGLPVSSEHGFTPHMTLAYDDRDVDVKPRKLRFTNVTIKLGDERIDYPLTGKAP